MISKSVRRVPLPATGAVQVAEQPKPVSQKRYLIIVGRDTAGRKRSAQLVLVRHQRAPRSGATLPAAIPNLGAARRISSAM
jgi:hypothetical protein